MLIFLKLNCSRHSLMVFCNVKIRVLKIVM